MFQKIKSHLYITIQKLVDLIARDGENKRAKVQSNERAKEKERETTSRIYYTQHKEERAQNYRTKGRDVGTPFYPQHKIDTFKTNKKDLLDITKKPTPQDVIKTRKKPQSLDFKREGAKKRDNLESLSYLMATQECLQQMGKTPDGRLD